MDFLTNPAWWTSRDGIASAGLILCLLVLAWQLYTLEHRSLYHPTVGNPRDQLFLDVGRDSKIGERIEDVRFTTSDGVTLHGWYVPPVENRPTLLFAHGNAGNIGYRRWTIKGFTDRGFGMLAFDYRGYGLSEGTPSEQGLYLDMDAANRFLEEEKGVPTGEQIAMGESLGGAVAIEIASRKQFKALFVYSTFTSIPEMAIEMRKGWWVPLPWEWLSRQHFNSAQRIGKVECPILMVHGDRDEMMPVEMSQKLFENVKSQRKKHVIVPGGTHNDVLYDGLIEELKELLSSSTK